MKELRKLCGLSAAGLSDENGDGVGGDSVEKGSFVCCNRKEYGGLVEAGLGEEFFGFGGAVESGHGRDDGGDALR